MKVVFRTNIDAYSNGDFFPENFTQVPRKGDMVQVKPDYVAHLKSLKLPICLEVVQITWKEPMEGEELTIVELWYNETDLKIARNNGAHPL